ncbi:MAG: sugar ABC transporter ATP-binding protein [Actinobacteria bacterium]|nr:sugar ABC transporter ATP-binding protein [Actinomycetota bacterium]
MTSRADSLLQVRGLSKTFPGLKALDDVSLEVASGEIVALVGQNGSGKSTLVKVLAGVHQPDPGAEIELGAEGRAGLHFIHQDLGLVGTLSTIENLDLGRRPGRRALMPAPVREEARHAEELVGGFGARLDVRAPVDRLSAAERAIVAIARALDGWEHDRNVLVLDEPTASLHGEEVERLFVAVRRVAGRGAGVIFISHRLDEVMNLADRVVCLRDGRLIADVPRGGYDHDDLVGLIAGEALAAAEEATPRPRGGPVLRAKGIRAPTIAGLDLDLHAGEILGVSGVLGSGREEVAASLFGAGLGTVEELEVDGAAVGPPDPRRSIAAGVAYVPGDRRREGAVMRMSVRENMTLPRLRPLRRLMGRLDRRAERQEVERWIERVAVRPAEPERALELFSGGNQQKVVLAKWLRNEPKALLMDEPTQGVDVGAKAGIFELIADAAAAGAGVLVCSSDAKELALICDRVLVMRDGEMVAEVSRGTQLSEAGLVRAGLGVVKSNGNGNGGTHATSGAEVSPHA